MEITKIGIAGMGTVGKAVYNGFSSVIPDIKCYDLHDHSTSIENLFECDFIFICVPATEIFDLVYVIVNCTKRNDITFVVKTTLTPGTTDELKRVYGNDWVFNPEFLTDRTANLDFINTNRIILGGTGGLGVEKVSLLYRERFHHTPIIRTTAVVAEFVKYMTNMYFMTKITFMNEMYNVSKKSGLPWDSVMKCFSTDGRIENSHLDVPGPDGKFGFGGKCFPENINTYIDWCEKMNLDHELIEVVRKINDKYRS